MPVVIAVSAGAAYQRSRQEGLYRVVRPAGHTSAKPDSGLRQRLLGSAANAAANQIGRAHV